MTVHIYRSSFFGGTDVLLERRRGIRLGELVPLVEFPDLHGVRGGVATGLGDAVVSAEATGVGA